MSNLVMCGYHGCHVIPPAEGCKCTGCDSQKFCEPCGEPQKRANEQFAKGDYHFQIRKCEECKQRAIEINRQAVK